MASILTSLIDVSEAVTLIGCCIILCVRELTVQLIETALTKPTPVSHQLLLSTAEIESQLTLNEFEEKNIN
jgi:hypothetical protein